MSPVINGVVTPIQGTVNSVLGVIGIIPIVGQVLPPLSIDATTLLNNAAAGNNIRLNVLNRNGQIVGAADPCDAVADSLTLETPRGIAVGGNKITGLGAAGQEALAGEINSIAFGNGATTDATAAGAIAFGSGADVGLGSTGGMALGTDAIVRNGALNAVALGSGSYAGDTNLALPAFNPGAGALAGVTASGEVSVGRAIEAGNPTGFYRRVTNVAAGAAATDAVNVSQLSALADVAIQYDDATAARLTLAGAGGTTIDNVAAGALNLTSTEAVNGSQLFATNQQVAIGATGIATNTADIAALSASAVTYDDAGQGIVTLGGASGTIVRNVAAGVDATDAVNFGQLDAVSDAVDGVLQDALLFDPVFGGYNAARGGIAQRIGNVAAGALNAGSFDAVNGSQLFATNQQVALGATGIASNAANIAALGASAVLYDDPSKGVITLGGGASGTVIKNVGAGVDDNDAVNVAQLRDVATGLSDLSDDALLFDSALGAFSASRGGVAQRIGNVAAGAVTATSLEAINGSQLFTTNQQVTQNTADIAGVGAGLAALNIVAVKYDDATLSSITFGGAAGTVLKNVASGVDDTDAVNLAQLRDATLGVASLRDNALIFDPASGTYNAARGGADRQITGIAAGTLSATSSDAVNGAQLFATNQQVSTNTTNIGGLNVRVTALEGIGGPGGSTIFQVSPDRGGQSSTSSGVNSLSGGANAVASGNGSTAMGNDAIASGATSTAVGGGAQALAANSVAIGNGSVADRANSVSVGAVGAARQITNVAAGTSPMDAVNLGQLSAGLSQSMTTMQTYVDGRFSQFGFDLAEVRRDAEGSTAAAMALAGIPQATNPGAGMVGMGISTWQGESAIAFGLSKAAGRIVVKAGAAYSSRGQGGANAGVGLEF